MQIIYDISKRLPFVVASHGDVWCLCLDFFAPSALFPLNSFFCLCWSLFSTLKAVLKCLVMLGCELIFKSEEIKSLLKFCVQSIGFFFFNWSPQSEFSGLFRDYPNIRFPREKASNLLQWKGDDIVSWLPVFSELSEGGGYRRPLCSV